MADGNQVVLVSHSIARRLNWTAGNAVHYVAERSNKSTSVTLLHWKLDFKKYLDSKVVLTICMLYQFNITITTFIDIR